MTARIATVSNYAAQTARLLYAQYSPNLFRRMTPPEQEAWTERQLAPLGLPAEEYAAIRQAFRDLMREDCPPGDAPRVNERGRMYR
jgi:hypothetical protein